MVLLLILFLKGILKNAIIIILNFTIYSTAAIGHSIQKFFFPAFQTGQTVNLVPFLAFKKVENLLSLDK